MPTCKILNFRFYEKMDLSTYLLYANDAKFY